MPQSISSNFVGELGPGIFMRLVETIDAFDQAKGGGLISRNVGFNESIFLPNLDITGKKIVPFSSKSVATIVAGQSAGDRNTIDYSERELATTDLTFPIGGIVPNEWRAVWGDLAPSPDVSFEEMMLNPQIRDAIFARIGSYAGQEDAYNIWQGDTATTGATYDNYDGVIKRIVDNADTVEVTFSGITTIDKTNVQEYLEEVHAELVKQPALKAHPNTKFIVSHKTMDAFENAEIAESGKGPLYSQFDGINRFKRVPIYTAIGFPDDVILCTHTSLSPLESTLHAGMRNATDQGAIEMGKEAGGAREWYFRMDYSMGTQITNPQNIIYLDARA